MTNHQLLIFLSILSYLVSSCEPKTFNIPTSAMEGTLKVGSKVWRASKSPQRGDIMIFKFPKDTNTYYIKRLVAIPGDSIEISGKKVYINGKEQVYPNTIQHSYTIYTKQRINDRIFKEQDISEYGRNAVGYGLHASDEKIAFFQNAQFIDSVRINQYPKEYHEKVYQDFTGWNRDYFGPYYLPKRGDEIKGKDQLNRYAQLILENEGVDVTNLNSYKFKRSYCFGMGDNRHNSLDSRYFGPIVMDLVRGKAVPIAL